MGYAPVPNEKCAAWLRRSVLTIGFESKERKAGGTGPGKVGAPGPHYSIFCPENFKPAPERVPVWHFGRGSNRAALMGPNSFDGDPRQVSCVPWTPVGHAKNPVQI
jgi:hypothetical protein